MVFAACQAAAAVVGVTSTAGSDSRGGAPNKAMTTKAALRNGGGSSATRGRLVVTRAKKSAIPRVEPEVDAPTPLTEEQLNSLPPEMLEKDIWAGRIERGGGCEGAARGENGYSTCFRAALKKRMVLLCVRIKI